jgi:transposase
MIKDNIRQMVRTLFTTGKPKKEIARFLGLDIKTVRKILQDGDSSPKTREDKILVEENLLTELYQNCNGYAQRIYEVLNEDYNINIGYSTVTRLVREMNLRKSKGNERSKRYPDIPGEEMQQDTSPYNVIIGGKKEKVVCSGIYFRYSKMRYVKFYHRFNRFMMKCFFYEALTWCGYTAKICIIDNTNLAVLYGTGENAVFHPEMLAFAKQYGFQWKAHRIKHPNRKAGKERNFLTLETNFFPGRRFKNLVDLNQQAKTWSTERFANRPLSKSRLIPSELFKYERPYLIKLSSYIQPPYQYHKRTIDEYGYVAFDGNYYWTPTGSKGEADITQYENKIDIYQKHKKLASYNLPAYTIKNKAFKPEGVKDQVYSPKNIKKGYAEEEKYLRTIAKISGIYIDFIKSEKCGIKQKPKFIRQLYKLSKKLDDTLFIATLERAHKYSICKIAALERIAGDLLKKDTNYTLDFTVSDGFEEREAYRDGKFSAESDLKEYKKLLDENEETHDDEN